MARITRGGSHRSKRSSKKTAVLAFASLVFLACCVRNLTLHSQAIAADAHHRSRNSEPSDNDAYRVISTPGGRRSIISGDAYRVISTIDRRNNIVSAPAPTWRPTTWRPTSVRPTTWTPTTATWSPTAQNQTSWGPTYGIASMIPTESLNAQTNENGLFYDDERLTHPRVACFIQNDMDNDWTAKPEKIKKGSSCNHDVRKAVRVKKHMPSIPLEAKALKGQKEDVEDENLYVENETCKYPDPTNRATATAPPTCNDIHALGFDPGMFEKRHHSSGRVPINYLTMGGAKCVWKVTSMNDEYGEETVIFKSNKVSRFLKQQFWDQNRKDALISGGMGNSQLSGFVQSQKSVPDESSGWNHVLPLYHYCGLANIVPYADGNLEEFIKNGDKRSNPRKLGPMDTLRVALQAARGLHQAHLYWNGKPTFVHADLNPSQFLVFVPRSHGSDKKESRNNLPIVQINDFNQGRFLIRSIKTNETCPFRSCSKNLRGNRYHTPERFTGCVDQDELIDTWSLGGVFFFLLTNGFDPNYDVRSYDKAIKSGKVPHVPRRLNLNHPAYDALKEVMVKCFAFKLRDRPSSLEVVRMLEAKLRQIET